MRRLCLLTFYIISEVPELVVDVKSSYYDKLANKLTEPSNSSKIYWSILKALFCNNKKIPLELPLYLDNKF